ncbi:hypothetical protein FZC76_05895 [Sutcliffiella horikoshii]|uniref:YesK-like protein n=1 Tax=Sutcliffiella horikoshii TaxID=79883 RepID=A0A5D4T303_9BACI|nr:hypothetical protein [Sutcliffiella horikoshii]TYS69765.1 hypothetical protein FZC76_05895 [Sutcliffiella horikoshii]
MMDAFLSLFIVVSLTILVAYFIYFVGKKKYPKISLYVPAITSAVGILFLYIKLKLDLYAQALSGIYDILGIIFLSVVFVISIIMALVLDFSNKWRSNA